MSYTLNGSSEKLLNVESRRRLEKLGDFNIEIDHGSLEAGLNTVEIKAIDSNNGVSRQIVTITHTENNIWPIPFTADWGSLNSISEVEEIAHVVDGLWKLPTSGGIRTTETGYDRTIAIGDMSWLTADYEVTVPFILHSNFSGIGFAVGWQGHEHRSGVVNNSPRLEWPLQALAWIRGGNRTLNIVTYAGPNPDEWEKTEISKQLTPLILNQKYMLKTASKPVGTTGMSKFKVKFWKETDSEPNDWSLSFDVPTRNGSVLLVAHEADVTFGNVIIDTAEGDGGGGDTTAPVISNIQVAKTGSTATISWETDELSTSVVDYGSTEDYGMNVIDSTMTRIHSITLAALTSNIDYHFRAKSVDGNGNMSSSTETFFISASTYELPRNEWHLISLPMNPRAKNKVSDVFGDNVLGEYGTSWAVFHYDVSGSKYVDLGLDGILEQGMGYWIIQMTNTTKILGMPAGSVSTPADLSGKFEIPLVNKGRK